MKVGNVVASLIAFIWGASVLVVALLGLNGARAESGTAYGTGRIAGLVFASLLVVAGARGLLKELGKRRA